MSDKAVEPAPLVPTRTEVEAAKLKILIDQKRDMKTPDWVLRVAKGLPPVAPAG